MKTKQVYVAISIDHEEFVEVAVYDEAPSGADMARDLGNPPVIKVATVIMPVPEAVTIDPEFVLDFTEEAEVEEDDDQKGE